MLGEVLILLSSEPRKPVPWLKNFQVFRDLDYYFVIHDVVLLLDLDCVNDINCNTALLFCALVFVYYSGMSFSFSFVCI